MGNQGLRTRIKVTRGTRAVARVVACAGLLACGPAMAEDGPARLQLEFESFLDVHWHEPAGGIGRDTLWWNKAAASLTTGIAPGVSLDLAAYAVGTIPDGREGGPRYPGQRSVDAPFADVLAAALRFDLGGAELLVGRSTVKMGTSRLFAPTDRFEPVDFNDPLHAFDAGRWQARLSAFLGPDTLSITLMPFDERDRQPGNGSRWLGPAGDASLYSTGAIGLPAGFVMPGRIDVREDWRSAGPGDWNWLAAWKGVRRGYDFFGAVHWGAGAYPTVRALVAPGTGPAPIVTVFKERPDAVSLAAGATTVVGAWNLYAEGIWQNTMGGRDEDFAKLSIGATWDAIGLADWLGVERIAPTIEYAADIVTDGAHLPGLRASSRQARPYRNAVLGEVRLTVDHRLSFWTSGSIDVEAGDSAASVGAEYKPTDSLGFTAQVQSFDGPDGTQFGRWKRNDGFYVGTRYAL